MAIFCLECAHSRPPLRIVAGKTGSLLMKPTLSANDVTVLDTLHYFDGDFSAVAAAVENGEFALWVGSGISREAPDLGMLIARAVEFIRQKAIDPAAKVAFEPALVEAIRIARIDPADARPYFSAGFDSWPMRDAIVQELWNNYSKLLDIRIPGEAEDYILWNAVDIRTAFAHPNLPAATHLAIAVLILEGAVRDIASGNWDGFIEAALARLSSGAANLIQVIVDPDHLRDAAGKARLYKFHGCIIHATADPGLYREFLTGSETQIIDWPNETKLSSIRIAVTTVATNLKTLMLGLSLQDTNLKGVFSAAKRANPWPWPCAPNAQGHVFCEDVLQPGQIAMLKTVYAGSYNDHIAQIHQSAHIRAWGEQVLIALVFKLLTDKLIALMAVRLATTPLAGALTDLSAALASLRDGVAKLAVGDRTVFFNRAIAVWSRALSLFRTGALPADPQAYEVLSTAQPKQLANDANAKTAGLCELGVALALFEQGRRDGLWSMAAPASPDLTSGALTTIATWVGATERPVFFVHSASAAITLQKAGAFANDNAIVVHADCAWHEMQPTGTNSARRPRRAPGRTGKVETRHISIAQLLDGAADAAALATEFSRAVTL